MPGSSAATLREICRVVTSVPETSLLVIRLRGLRMRIPTSQLRGVRCPVCESGELRRSRTRFWETPLRAFGIRPYRCMCCWYRGYVLFLPFRFVLQLTTRGTARRFDAMVMKAVSELLAKVRLAFKRSTQVFHLRHFPVSNQPQVSRPAMRKT